MGWHFDAECAGPPTLDDYEDTTSAAPASSRASRPKAARRVLLDVIGTPAGDARQSACNPGGQIDKEGTTRLHHHGIRALLFS